MLSSSSTTRETGREAASDGFKVAILIGCPNVGCCSARCISGTRGQVADFCLQCNLEMGFGPYSDFAHFGENGTITEDQVNRGYGIPVLCEGCGPIHVDHKGRCISDDCLGHGTASEVLRDAETWRRRRSGPLGALWRLRDRLLGTPWEPGYVHHLRWRWHEFHPTQWRVCETCGRRFCGGFGCRIW